MNKVVFIGIVCLFCELAQAREQSIMKAKDKRVYILKNRESFIEIKKSTPVNETLIMRDPNLGASLSTTQVSPMQKKKLISKAKTKPVKSAVAFKPMQIAGSVRMPRVEFGRILLPVGIREESQNLNFSDRSLQDLP